MDDIGNAGSGTAVRRLAARPGAELQAALALIDTRDLSGTDLALMLVAQARLLAWVQASMAFTINEFVHCPPCSAVPTARVEAVQEFARDELALVLHVAPMTGRYLALDAVDLLGCHPRLWAALSDGLIDLRKVKTVTTLCPDTDTTLAAALDDALLSTAPRPDGSTALGQTIADTPRALGLRAQRILSALDPSWTRASRRETLGRRRLVTGTHGAGIGVDYLGLHDIDVTAMAAAYDHVNAIARGIKRFGDTRTLDQVRADTALDLLTGGTPTPVHQAEQKTRTATTTDTATNAKSEEPSDGAASNAKDTADTDQPAEDENADRAAAAQRGNVEDCSGQTPGDADTTAGAGSATDSAPNADEVAEVIHDDAAGTDADVDPEPPATDADADVVADEVPIPPPSPVARARADVAGSGPSPPTSPPDR